MTHQWKPMNTYMNTNGNQWASMNKQCTQWISMTHQWTIDVESLKNYKHIGNLITQLTTHENPWNTSAHPWNTINDQWSHNETHMKRPWDIDEHINAKPVNTKSTSMKHQWHTHMNTYEKSMSTMKNHKSKETKWTSKKHLWNVCENCWNAMHSKDSKTPTKPYNSMASNETQLEIMENQWTYMDNLWINGHRWKPNAFEMR